MSAPSDVRSRAGNLTDRWRVPPFSVLDTRQGYWRAAHRAWLALGIRSEVGRGFNEDGPDVQRAAMHLRGLPGDGRVNTAAMATDPGDGFGMVGPSYGSTRRDAERASNVTDAPKLPDWVVGVGLDLIAPGTSIFDPVLCELMYRWFAPAGGQVLDPFAGGSVRGIVAAWLGHPYTGVDLSAAQVASNEEQADFILSPAQPRPRWIRGDSRVIVPTLGDEWADLVFTCPPYYDLEVYSDDPADLSNAPSWPAFLDLYGEIIGASLQALRRDRFAVIVVSEIRDPKTGLCRGLVPWTIRQFEMYGAQLYNEAVLVNMPGTLPLRAGRQFSIGRKLGRTHQNILVFVKGTPPRTSEWDDSRPDVPDAQVSWVGDGFVDDLG